MRLTAAVTLRLCPQPSPSHLKGSVSAFGSPSPLTLRSAVLLRRGEEWNWLGTMTATSLVLLTGEP